MNDLFAALRDPATIRLRCAAITQAVAAGRSSFFQIDRSRLGVPSSSLMTSRFSSSNEYLTLVLARLVGGISAPRVRTA